MDFVVPEDQKSKNQMHKHFWDFGIEMDNLIPDKIAGLISVNKKKRRSCNLMNCVFLL